MGNVSNSLAADVAKGAVAGTLGTWALGQTTSFLWEREDPKTRSREEAVRPLGLDPSSLFVARAAKRAGRKLKPGQSKLAGRVVHYSLGIFPGVAYSLLRRRSAAVSSAGGTLFGVGMFLLEDELANRVFRLAAPPKAYPWQAHARGLVAHLVFGATIDLALRLMDRAMPPRRPSRWSRLAGR